MRGCCQGWRAGAWRERLSGPGLSGQIHSNKFVFVMALCPGPLSGPFSSFTSECPFSKPCLTPSSFSS